MNSNLQKARPWSQIIPALVVLLVFVCAGGCHSKGYKKGDVAARSLQTAADEVQAESRSIDATMEALNDLVHKPAADLKPQFAHFSKALDRLKRTAAQTERTRERMEVKNAEYFDAWDRQTAEISFGVVREQSESRKAAVTNQFHTVNTRYLEAQDVVRPLISYFEDIRKALSIDLTPEGLESIQSIADNAERNARKVQTALSRLTEELAASSTELSTVRVRDRVVPEAAAAESSK
jgi:hypothetical protein